MHSPAVANGASIVRSATPGAALFVTARVVDGERRPIAGAQVDIWHASPDGLYENQDAAQADMNLRGRFVTDDAGEIWFRSVRMTGYPIPADGVVGRLLSAQGRHPFRPAHLHALVVKPGYKVLISQTYDPADPHIDTDVQFGVTKTLLGNFVRHDTPHPADAKAGTPWYSLDHTYVMERGDAVLPQPPIK
jgi:catechol 1,2-dioxygenase